MSRPTRERVKSHPKLLYRIDSDETGSAVGCCKKPNRACKLEVYVFALMQIETFHLPNCNALFREPIGKATMFI
jgi:hypothetical protein